MGYKTTPQLFECNKPVCAKWKYALFKILNPTIARGVSHLVNHNDISNFASKFQISVKFHLNFIFPGPFVFQISWQIS